MIIKLDPNITMAKLKAIAEITGYRIKATPRTVRKQHRQAA